MTNNSELQKAADKLYKSTQGNARRLSMIAAQFQQAAGKLRVSGPLMVVGGVSAVTGKPYVQIEWGAEVGQVDVDMARGFCQNVVEACANATAEAAILAWGRDELDLDQEQVIRMIGGLRHHRHDRWGQPDLELELQNPPPEEEQS